MRIDSDLLDSAIENKLDYPIFRLYAWKPACVSLGRNQKDDFLDRSFLKENNIDTYSIINRITKYPNDKLISYIDKLIPVIDDFTLRNILDKIKDNEEVMNYVIDKYLINSTISIKLTSFLLKNNLYIDKVYQNFDNIISNNIKDLYELKKQGTLNKETSTKSFVLRVDAETMDAIEAWAADEFRSINGQLQWIIAEALRKNGRQPKKRKIKTEEK